MKTEVEVCAQNLFNALDKVLCKKMKSISLSFDKKERQVILLSGLLSLVSINISNYLKKADVDDKTIEDYISEFTKSLSKAIKVRYFN